jgi:DNA integrity scanning protein DisA with diadenylate cyclase activity
LSEQADVVVVIISEERGSISFAYQGELLLDIDPTELRSLLQLRLPEISAG